MKKADFNYSFKKVINFLTDLEPTFNGWLFGFFTLLAGSVFMQNFLYGLGDKSVEVFVMEALQPFYLILIISMIIIFQLFLKEEIAKISFLVLWSMWFTLPRPLVDRLILGESNYLSFYLIEAPKELLIRFLTYFGSVDKVGILYGTRLELTLILVFVFFYLYLKKHKISIAFFASFLVYLVFFVICSLPSFLAIPILLSQGLAFNEIGRADVAGLFISPFSFFGGNYHGFEAALFYKTGLIYNLILVFLLGIFQFLKDKQQLIALFKNIRLPQSVFTAILLLSGMIAAYFYYPSNLTFDFFSVLVLANLILAIFFAWQFSVVINDIEDLEIDKVSNQKRPLVQNIFTISDFKNYGSVFLLLAYLLALTVGLKYFLIILLYTLLTWIYSKPPFKIKRIPILASMLSAWAILLVFLLGWILVADNQALKFFPYRIVSFLFLVATFTIPLKDLKDVVGDKGSRIYTLPVLLGKEKTCQFVSWVLLLAYLISPFIFQKQELFWVAMILGLVNFIFLNKKRVNQRKILPVVLMIAFIYALIIYFWVL